jgi:hypothetical protein
VVRIDGKTLGDGKPGAITQRLHKLYRDLSFAEASRVPGSGS